MALSPRKNATRPDPEDVKEPPETPGETPDAEDTAEGPESVDAAPSDAGEGAGDKDAANVTPQEQHTYDAVVTYAYKLIFSPNYIQGILRKFAQGSNEIPATIGSTGAMILKSVSAKAKQQDQVDIPGDVLYAAAGEIIGALIDLAVGAGMAKEADRQDIAKKALFAGLQLWGKTMQSGGQITPDVQSQAKQQLAMNGIKQTAPGGAPSAPPGPPPTGIANAGLAAPQGAPQ